MAPVEITIATPCYNAGKLIAELADSLCQQTFKHFQWCIVDDGSDKHTREVIEEIKRHSGLDVIVEYHDKSGGNFCRNRGFDLGTGDLVKFVDADDLLEPDLLANQFKTACEAPSAVVVSKTRILFPDQRQIECELDPELLIDPLRSFLRKPTFMHGGCLVRRSLVEKIGGWDEGLTAGQDLDFFRRILLEAPAIAFAKSAFVYRQHASAPRISNLSNKDQAKFESHLRGLDHFVTLLDSAGKLSQYDSEIARNYDVWGMKALGLRCDIGQKFIERAIQLSPDGYQSGSRYAKLLRPIFGDRSVARLMRSSSWKKTHRWLTRMNLWPAS